MADAGVMVMEKAITASLRRPRGRGAAGARGRRMVAVMVVVLTKRVFMATIMVGVDRCRVMEPR